MLIEVKLGCARDIGVQGKQMRIIPLRDSALEDPCHGCCIQPQSPGWHALQAHERCQLLVLSP